MSDKFTLEFGVVDFDELTRMSCKSYYTLQPTRFEVSDGYYDRLPTSDVGWQMYWMGENTFTAIVGEKILLAAGYKVHRLWDRQEYLVPNKIAVPEWCILTTYVAAPFRLYKGSSLKRHQSN